MGSYINHYCIICGVGYHSCDSCNAAKKIKPWQVIACTNNHYKVYLIVNDFVHGVINKKQAKKMLASCNIEDYKNYKENVVEILDQILLDQNKK